MTWHYLPVWLENEDGTRTYLLCEVYLDSSGRLSDWTELSEISGNTLTATGHDHDELTTVLSMMLNDCSRWEAVRYTDLSVGMTFQRAGVRVKISDF